MADQYQVIAKVISQKGTCEAGHKVGDEFPMGHLTEKGICSAAYCAISPFAMVLTFGGDLPWEKDKDKTTVACPDAENPVVFELRRTRE